MWLNSIYQNVRSICTQILLTLFHSLQSTICLRSVRIISRPWMSHAMTISAKKKTAIGWYSSFIHVFFVWSSVCFSCVLLSTNILYEISPMSGTSNQIQSPQLMLILIDSIQIEITYLISYSGCFLVSVEYAQLLWCVSVIEDFLSGLTTEGKRYRLGFFDVRSSTFAGNYPARYVNLRLSLGHPV